MAAAAPDGRSLPVPRLAGALADWRHFLRHLARLRIAREIRPLREIHQNLVDFAARPSKHQQNLSNLRSYCLKSKIFMQFKIFLKFKNFKFFAIFSF